MKRRLIMVMGIASPMLLAGCAAAILLVSIAGWWLLKPEQKSRIIQVIPLAPLKTPVAEVTSVAGENPATEASAVPEAELSAEIPEAQPDDFIPSNPIEEALGFALPAGSVDSITQEGVASRLVIPKLNLDAPVVIAPIQNETWQVDHLGQAVGHLEGTAPPGSNSNIVLAGHVTISEGVYGPFAGLGNLTAGDTVTVYEGDQKFDYVVDGYQTVDRTAIEVTYPTATGQITLITCNNWSSEEGRYIERLVVKGHLIN
ncbi:MAG: sortase [Chloroflexi bacterium]|nr:sortase [Chloroflexota bacterium]